MVGGTIGTGSATSSFVNSTGITAASSVALKCQVCPTGLELICADSRFSL